MNNKLIKFNKIILALFVVIQPILNVLRGTSFRLINVCGLSLLELINIFIIFISIILTFWALKGIKNKILYISSFLIFIIYMILHYLNMKHFNINLYAKSDINFMKENYYLIRTFIVPLYLLINMFISKFNKKEIITLIMVISFVCSTLIVIPNIFGFANLSYIDDKITFSIFDWFTFDNVNNYSYYYLASKGIFYSANQISAIMLMLSPIVIYKTYNDKSILNYIILFMHTLAMFMLGTRTANLGIMLIYIFFILLHFVFKILKKDTKSIKQILIIFAFFICLFFYSPIYYKFNTDNKVETVISVIDRTMKSDDVTSEEKKKIINNSYDSYEEIIKGYKILENIRSFDCNNLSNDDIKVLNEYLVDYRYFNGIPSAIYYNYSLNNNDSFWCSYLSNNSSTDFRKLKVAIINDVYKQNNNKMDKYLGLGYTTGIMYTEVDYYYQFYNYGIFGLLLFVCPYIFVLGYFGISILKNFKNKFNIQNLMLGMALGIGLIIPYLSGHVFERIFPLVILALLSSLILSTFNDEEDNKRVLFISSTGGHLNEMLQLKELINKYDSYIITENTKSNKSLKKKYKHVNYLVYGTKDHLFTYIFKFSYNCVKSLILYLIIRPDVVITTGAHTAVPMCYIGKFFGSKIIFIESFANSSTKTISGRLVYPIADYFIVQWEEMLKFYPNAVYGGWIY